ncbi:MAG: ApaG domain [Verrucomicrobiota bacterium]
MKPHSQDIHELKGLHVTVDSLQFDPHAQAPPDRPYAFRYTITIENKSPVGVKIHGRKWIIRDKDGRVEVVEGEGVVGKSPELPPGEKFTYQSYHLIHSESVAEGSYFGLTDQKQAIFTRIPMFEMHPPQEFTH